jgi:hypothetical protein
MYDSGDVCSFSYRTRLGFGKSVAYHGLCYGDEKVGKGVSDGYRILLWILTLHSQHNVLRTIFRRFYGNLCACINSGSQAVSPPLEMDWV